MKHLHWNLPAAGPFSCRLATVRYDVRDVRLAAPARLAVIADLHGAQYGDGQAELLEALAALAPQLVLLSGDIVDDVLPEAPAWTLLERLGAAYPSFYVTGNHEVHTGRLEAIKRDVAACGIAVLDGDAITVRCGRQRLALCGVDDPIAFPRPRGKTDPWREQLLHGRATAAPGAFTILLTHRPERVRAYRAAGFDLVLAGHAHGGQVRIPGLFNGLYAPNQGIFPAYAGGLYDLGGGTRMVVSRGLSQRILPRVWNRPELVAVDLLPPET